MRSRNAAASLDPDRELTKKTRRRCFDDDVSTILFLRNPTTAVVVSKLSRVMKSFRCRAFFPYEKALFVLEDMQDYVMAFKSVSLFSLSFFSLSVYVESGTKKAVVKVAFESRLSLRKKRSRSLVRLFRYPWVLNRSKEYTREKSPQKKKRDLFPIKP